MLTWSMATLSTGAWILFSLCLQHVQDLDIEISGRRPRRLVEKKITRLRTVSRYLQSTTKKWIEIKLHRAVKNEDDSKTTCWSISLVVSLTGMPRETDAITDTNPYGDYSRFRRRGWWAAQWKVKDAEGKEQWPSLTETIQLVCVSQETPQRKSLLCENGKMGSNHTIKFSKANASRTYPGKEGSTAGNQTKVRICGRHPWTPKFEERTEDETLKQGRCAHRNAWDSANDVYELKRRHKTHALPVPSSGNAGTFFDEDGRETFRDRLWSFFGNGK